MELLAIFIRKNEKIKGIKCKNTEYKISQYADDTTIKAENESLNEILVTLEEFRKFSGWKINMKKTNVLRLGSLKKSELVLESGRKLTWTDGSISVLGAEITVELETICDINYTDRIKGLEQTLNSWEYRNLSLLGKICIVNTLGISKLIFLLSSLVSPSKKQMQQINNIIYNFIWNGKPDKIKRKVLSAPIDRGGAKLVNVDCKNKSLKFAWIKRLTENDTIIPLIERYTYLPLKYLLRGNLNSKDLQLYINPKLYCFWKEILYIWVDIVYKDDNRVDEIDKQKILLNSYIRIGNKPVFWASWCDKGLNFVGQLFNEDGELFTKQEVEQKFDIVINHLQWNSLITAIPRHWKKDIKDIRTQHPSHQDVIYKSILDILLEKYVKWTKWVYDEYIFRITDEIPQVVEKWNGDLGTDDIAIQWEDICDTQKIIKSSILRSFHFKFLHRVVPYNNYLYKCKIVDSPMCEFCKSDIQTLVHLFWDCPIINEIWSFVINWISEKYSLELELDKDLFLLSKFYEENSLICLISIIVKYYIHVSKCTGSIPTKEGALNRIAITQRIEKYISLKNNMYDKYQKFWVDFDGILFEE